MDIVLMLRAAEVVAGSLQSRIGAKFRRPESAMRMAAAIVADLASAGYSVSMRSSETEDSGEWFAGS